MVAYELILRGIAIGALIAAATGIWRVAQGKSIGPAGLLLCIAAIGHVLESSRAFSTHADQLYPIINFVSLGATGFLWLFVVALFEDRPLGLKTLAPVAGLIVLGLAAYTTALRPVWLLQKLCEAGLALHALFVVLRTWRGDLVEARLRIRTPFVALVAVYALLMAGLQIAGLELPARDMINAAALAVLGIAGAAIFLRGPADLLGAIGPQPPAPPANAADQAVLERLNRAMDADEIWRREGLTIGALADVIGVPEHRLRPLINDHLGFRNFAAFINAARIKAAKRLLTAPAHARTTVAAIAFDLGFGSLGPFNRAFKEATGVTPTEYRRGAPPLPREGEGRG
jgi:AraC-like DNA-binding protein